VRVRLTHQLRSPSSADALGLDETGRRLFVPGWIPCGECARCRRGLVAACPRGRRVVPAGETAGALSIHIDDLEPRFLTPVDEPAGAAPLADEDAACAGVLAEVIDASARAGLGPEQIAVWLGDDARSTLGARLAARRGCPTYLAGAGDSADLGPTLLPLDDSDAWRRALGGLAAGPGELRLRRLFVAGSDPAASAVARSLLEPGATLSFLPPVPAAALDLRELTLCRVIVGAGYHPDLVTEALSLLRADPALVEALVVPGTAAVPGRLVLSRLPG